MFEVPPDVRGQRGGGRVAARGITFHRFADDGPDIDGLGAHVSRGGDVDGDGVNNLQVGAAHGRVPEAGGYVEIFSPGAGFALLQRISGPRGRSEFGRGVCGGLDVDGDGQPDLVIGATAMPGFERVLQASEAR